MRVQSRILRTVFNPGITLNGASEDARWSCRPWVGDGWMQGPLVWPGMVISDGGRSYVTELAVNLDLARCNREWSWCDSVVESRPDITYLYAPIGWMWRWVISDSAQ